MTAFVLIAAAMTAAAVLLIVWPLYRARAERSRSTLIAIVIAVLLVPPSAAYLYYSLSNWNWDPRAVAAAGSGQPDVAEMIAKLEARLKDHPDDVDGWLMLGRSRVVLRNPQGAVAAYAEAYRASQGKNVEAIVDYGETLVMTDPSSLRAKAADLFEEALKLDASNPKALFYSGMAAVTSGRGELARTRWVTLLHEPLPEQIRAVLATRIAELDGQLGRPPDPEIARLAASSTAPEESPSAAATPPAAGPGPGAATVNVSIAPALSARVPAGAPLYVLARDPTQPGPPFAAKRISGAMLPLTVTLTEQDAMMPSRTLKNAHQLLIVARFSASGAPQAASGDLFGETPYDLALGRPVALVIDKQVP